MNMSTMFFELEMSNSTMEQIQPDDQVAFFTLFSVIAIVVIISITILIITISCPQDFTAHLLGFHCRSNTCGCDGHDDEKKFFHCRNGSVLTCKPAAPVDIIVGSVNKSTTLSSSYSSVGSKNTTISSSRGSVDSRRTNLSSSRSSFGTGRTSTVLSNSRRKVDPINTFRKENGNDETIEHIYDVIPDPKSRHRDGKYTSVQTKLKRPHNLSTRVNSDHYQTPSPTTCQLQCCHGNKKTANKKQDSPQAPHDDDATYHDAKHNSIADPVQAQLDLKIYKSNRKEFLYNMKPSEKRNHSYKILHPERKTNPVTRDDTIKMEYHKNHNLPNLSPHGKIDKSGQYDPLNSRSANVNDLDVFKYSTQPRLPSGYENLSASDETKHLSRRLIPPRYTCRSSCLSCGNEVLPPSLYHNGGNPVSKRKKSLISKPEGFHVTNIQCQGHHKCIPTCNDNNIHSPNSGFSESLSSGIHFKHEWDQTCNSLQNNCYISSLPSQVRTHVFHNDNISPFARNVVSSFDLGSSTKLDASEDLTFLSSQFRTSTIDRISSSSPCQTVNSFSCQKVNSLAGPIVHSFSGETGHSISCPPRQLPSVETRYFPSDQSRHLSGKTRHFYSNETRYLPSGQIKHCFASDQAEVDNSSRTDILKSLQQQKKLIKSNLSESSQNFGGNEEYGQKHPVINHLDPELQSIRKQALKQSIVKHTSKISTHLAAKGNFRPQDACTRLSQPYITETSKCFQKIPHQKSYPKKIPKPSITKSNKNGDFLFHSILPFKDACQQGQGHRPEREELKRDQQNQTFVCNNFSDYVIMNNPYISMTSSDCNADSPKPCLSTEMTQGKATSGQSDEVFQMASVAIGIQDKTLPYRFHTPGDAIQSIKSYMRRNFSP